MIRRPVEVGGLYQWEWEQEAVSSGFDYLAFPNLLFSWIDTSGVTASGGFLDAWAREAGTLDGSATGLNRPAVSGDVITFTDVTNFSFVSFTQQTITGSFYAFAVCEIDSGNDYAFGNIALSSELNKTSTQGMRMSLSGVNRTSTGITTATSGVHIFYWGRNSADNFPQFAYDLGAIETGASAVATNLILDRVGVNNGVTLPGIGEHFILGNAALSAAQVAQTQADLNIIHGLGL